MKTIRVCWTVALLLGAGCQPSKPTYTMGIISALNPQVNREAYKPLIAYLERRVGCEIMVDPVVNYAHGVERMTKGSWDLAFANTQTYLEARPAGFKPLVMVTEAGKSYYHAIFIVNKESPIRTLAQLKGKRVAFVSKKSASGYIYPMKLLLDQGMSPAQDLDMRFTGDAKIIGKTINQPNRGSRISFDAGTVFDGIYKHLEDNGQHLRVLATSEPIPHIPVVVNAEIANDQALFEQFQQAFLSAKAEVPEAFEDEAIFFDGFVEAEDRLYDQVEVVEKAVKAYEATHPIEDKL